MRRRPAASWIAPRASPRYVFPMTVQFLTFVGAHDFRKIGLYVAEYFIRKTSVDLRCLAGETAR